MNTLSGTLYSQAGAPQHWTHRELPIAVIVRRKVAEIRAKRKRRRCDITRSILVDLAIVIWKHCIKQYCTVSTYCLLCGGNGVPCRSRKYQNRSLWSFLKTGPRMPGLLKFSNTLLKPFQKRRLISCSNKALYIIFRLQKRALESLANPNSWNLTDQNLNL